MAKSRSRESGALTTQTYWQFNGVAVTLFYAIVLFYSARRALGSLSTYGSELHEQLNNVTRLLVVVALPISFHHIWDHLSNFRKPSLQSQIVRISWMVPMFCCESFLSMQFVRQATYFQAAREVYEAYVLYCFMRLIVQYLTETSGGLSAAERTASYPASMGVHKPPFCCLAPWQMGADFVSKCKAGVVQYVMVRFATALLTVVLFAMGIYEEGKYGLTKPFIWITTVNFVSQSWALYTLFLFFLCVHKELHGIRPFSKFLCIKMIIFTSWWQALLIGILVRVGRIHHSSGHSAHEMAVFIRCTAISAEMVIAAVAFAFAFPLSEFLSAAGLRKLESVATKGGRSVMKLLAGYHRLARSRPVATDVSLSGVQERAGATLPSALTPAEVLMAQASSLLQYCGLGDASDEVTPSTVEACLEAGSRGSVGVAVLQHGPEMEQDLLLPAFPAQVPRCTAKSFESLTYSDSSPPTKSSRNEAVVHSAPLTPPRPLLPQQLRHTHSANMIPQLNDPLESPPSQFQPQLRQALRGSPNLFRRESSSGIGQSSTGMPLSPSGAGGGGGGGSVRRGSGATGAGRGLSFASAIEQNELQQRLSAISIGKTAPEEPVPDSDSSYVSDSSRDGEGDGAEASPALNINSLLADVAFSGAGPVGGRGTVMSAGGASTKARARPGSSSKGHRPGGNDMPWIDALWMSILPSDLHEDLRDLLMQVMELHAAVLAFLATRRMLKGTARALVGKRMVV